MTRNASTAVCCSEQHGRYAIHDRPVRCGKWRRRSANTLQRASDCQRALKWCEQPRQQTTPSRSSHIHTSHPTSTAMGRRSCLAYVVPAILKSNNPRSGAPPCSTLRVHRQTFLAPRRLVAPSPIRLVTTRVASNPPVSVSLPSVPNDSTAEEDDRWRAAYLESLMKKAGELSVKGEPCSPHSFQACHLDVGSRQSPQSMPTETSK